MSYSTRLSQLLITAGLPLMVVPAAAVPESAPTTSVQSVASPDLIRAAADGKLAKAQAVLQSTPSLLNVNDTNGVTPLMAAATNGHLPVVQMLLAAKADLEKTSKQGETALMFAAFNGHNDIVQAVHYFNENYSQNISIEQYAASRSMSTSWFNRSFRSAVGTSPMKYILEVRIRNAQVLLETTDYSISDIASIIGYDNPLYFSRLFSRKFAMSPSEYRKKYAVFGALSADDLPEPEGEAPARLEEET